MILVYGYDFSQRLSSRDETADIPVVFMTALGGIEKVHGSSIKSIPLIMYLFICLSPIIPLLGFISGIVLRNS